MSRTWNNLKYNIKYCWNPVKWVPASILCVRFPFLYPRNRFSGKHYTNWRLSELASDEYSRAYKLDGEAGNKDNPVKIIKVSNWHAFLRWLYNLLEDIIGIFHCIPYYTELDGMDSGWRKTFGIQMCGEIKKALLDAGGRKMLKRYRITDIKEKFGSLRWYDEVAPEEVKKIIAKYEYISLRTCIKCGKTADYVTRGWVEPYCKDCLPERYDRNDPEQVDRYYTEENSWYGWVKYFNSDKNKEENKENNVNEG